MRGICAFLGLEFEEGMLGAESGAAPSANVPEWSWSHLVAEEVGGEDPIGARALFSSARKQELQGLLGPALAERNYPPATG